MSSYRTPNLWIVAKMLPKISRRSLASSSHKYGMQSELKDADVNDAKWDNYGWYLGAKSMLGVFFFYFSLDQ